MTLLTFKMIPYLDHGVDEVDNDFFYHLDNDDDGSDSSLSGFSLLLLFMPSAMTLPASSSPCLYWCYCSCQCYHRHLFVSPRGFPHLSAVPCCQCLRTTAHRCLSYNIYCNSTLKKRGGKNDDEGEDDHGLVRSILVTTY